MTNDQLQRAKAYFDNFKAQSSVVGIETILTDFAAAEIARERAEIADELLAISDNADEDYALLQFRYYAEALREKL